MSAEPYPCETCGGVVVLMEGEPVCVRDSWCLHLPGCDGRAHQIQCNERFYSRAASSEVGAE